MGVASTPASQPLSSWSAFLALPRLPVPAFLPGVGLSALAGGMGAELRLWGPPCQEKTGPGVPIAGGDTARWPLGARLRGLPPRGGRRPCWCLGALGADESTVLMLNVSLGDFIGLGVPALGPMKEDGKEVPCACPQGGALLRGVVGEGVGRHMQR